MIPDFMVQYGNARYKQGFITGYSAGMLLTITIAVAAEVFLGSSKSPRALHPH
jgi:hypothetical protein